MAPIIVITTTTEERLAEANQLANSLNIPFYPEKEIPKAVTLLLLLTPDYIGLQSTNYQTLPVYVDFLAPSFIFRLQRATLKNELLARAMGVKPQDHPSILDATAGLGRDSFILASLGFNIVMVESSPIVHLLLKDGLERAAKNSEYAKTLNHLTLIFGDAVNCLKNRTLPNNEPDVIYLDPMFPERQKTASVKKEMVILQELLPKADNLPELFQQAITCAKKRVVIKRPRLAKPLADKPSYSLIGKANRFDIYLTKT